MNLPSNREIEQRLRAEPASPPEGLVERIKSEIPERPRVVSFPASGESSGGSGGRWAIAATVALAVISVGITVRLSEEVSPAREPEQVKTMPIVMDAPDREVAEAKPSTPVAGPVTGGEVREEAVEVLPTDAATIQRPAEPEAPERDPFAQQVPSQSLATADTGAMAAEPLAQEKKVEMPSQLRRSARPSAVPEGMLMARPRAVTGDRRQYPASPYPVAPPSTGGTTEPNDQPYGDMFFKSWGVNPFIDTEDDALSTFGLDVDTGSYTLARSYIERGHLPPSEAVRVEELINYFDYGDRPPRRGDFAIRAEAAPSPFAEGPRYHLLRFNLRGREIDASERQPASLIFVVDVSGSMNRENRLELVKRSLYLLLDQLRSGDRVGLVVYGSSGRVLLEPTGDLERIRWAIERLRAEGSTNAEEGLVLAYELADRYYRSGAINRVVLCSDGVANVGRTGPDSILARIEAASERGIELTTIGFGMGNYNDLLMEQLADRGDGSYAYVDTLDEARRVFVENLTGMLQTIAAEAKAQVEFDPDVVARYRLLGYENRDIADEDFRNDSVDAGEIGAGHSVTALYEIKLHENVRRNATLATLRLRYESKAEGRVVEVAEPVRVGDIERRWEDASPALRLTSLVAEFGEILRESYWAKDGDLNDVFARSQKVSTEFAGDVEVAGFVSLVGRAARLADDRPVYEDED